MYVEGIGDITGCNSKNIFVNGGGIVPATVSTLQHIYDTAAGECSFYRRLHDEIFEMYQKRYKEVTEKYHYISDEDIQEAREAGKNWLYLQWEKDGNNAECSRQYYRMYGLSDVSIYALEQKVAVTKIFYAAKSALEAARREG